MLLQMTYQQLELLIPYIVNTSKTETKNIYSEYIWIPATSTYEKFGDLAIDMSSKANVTEDMRKLVNIL